MTCPPEAPEAPGHHGDRDGDRDDHRRDGRDGHRRDGRGGSNPDPRGSGFGVILTLR